MPQSPNLHQTCILGYSRLVLKIEVIDLDLQDHFGHFDLEFLKIWFICMITCNGFQLESPNFYQICILGFSQLLLKMEVFDLPGHLAIIPILETAFNVALVYWSRPAKGCYMSQTCSCSPSGERSEQCILIRVIPRYWMPLLWMWQSVELLWIWHYNKFQSCISRNITSYEYTYFTYWKLCH